MEATNPTPPKPTYAQLEHQLAAVTGERDEAKAELTELNRKLDVVLYDVDYKGGLQDWQARAHKATMTAFETGIKLVEVAQKLAESESARDALAKAVGEIAKVRAKHRRFQDAFAKCKGIAASALGSLGDGEAQP